ncbi:MAG TPA: DedA family protein [Geobacterales bacterium]|nr:DedA family protein [Geobacterales bacterium]
MAEFFCSYLQQYGYWVLFVGTFIEGEAVLVMAGYLASQGYLSLPLVMVVAFAGAFIGDQFYFYLGRWQGALLLRLFTLVARKFRKALRLIERYGSLVAVISRYTYGFRIVLPIILGMSTFSGRTFLLLNLASAALWALIFALAGFLFGRAASLLVKDMDRFEPYVLASLAGLIIVSWFAHLLASWWRGRRARQRLVRRKRQKGMGE